MSPAELIGPLTTAAVAGPLLLLALLGVPAFARRRLSEAATGALVAVTYSLVFLLLAAAATLLVLSGKGREVVDLGDWFAIPGYHFQLRLLVDGLSMPYAVFTAALCGVLAVFAHRYLHREPGHLRFFVLLSVFSLGMLLVVLAGTIEVVFAGWELVGLGSALLVAFFQDRPLPAENGLRVFVVYRACDVGILVAAVLCHHYLRTGDFVALFGEASWPGGELALDSGRATAIAGLLVVSAMGKCAQVPFSGWLPRAMEGPTPSSAIFYGALSVHAGAYLLLRFAPLLERAPAAGIALLVIGLLTSAHAALVGRAQTDIKAALAYASLTQVGLVLAEIGLGLYVLAVVHVVGHASLRSLQFLRAPSLLHDLHQVEAAVGGHLVHVDLHPERRLNARWQDWVYRFALERAYLDELLERFVERPFVAFFSACDRLERRLTDGMGRKAQPESEPRAEPRTGEAR